jgi:hypothetical protein
MSDLYAEAVIEFEAFLEKVKDAEILTRKDVLREAENVFPEELERRNPKMSEQE